MRITYAHEVQSDSDRIFLKKTMGSVLKLNPIGIVVLVLVGVMSLYYIHRTWWPNRIDPPPRGEINLKKLLSASIYAAERGGIEVKKVRREADLHEQSKGKTREGANNPVTDGDMKSHEAIVYALKTTFPGLPIVSEEHEDKLWDPSKIIPLSLDHPELSTLTDMMVPMKDVTVWVDPLDATQEYTENLINYVTTMVAVAYKGNPIIGVIHKPFKETEKTVWAWVGHGHSNNLKLPAFKASIKTSPRIIVSRSHQGGVKKVATEAFGQDVTVTPAGGAGFKVLELFEDNADVYIHTTLIKKWDICAGNAILLEMNGHMTTLAGATIKYGYDTDPKNEGGLLATIWDHQNFLKKFEKAEGA